MASLSNNGNENTPEMIRAVRKRLDLGDRFLDGCELPDGEIRVVGSTIGPAIGYAENWFYRLQNKGKKYLEALTGKGFTGYIKEVTIADRGGARGASKAGTISLRDLNKILLIETKNGNGQAAELLATFSEEGMEATFKRLLSGESNEHLKEKIQHYRTWTQDEWEEIAAYNREEAKALNAWRQQG